MAYDLKHGVGEFVTSDGRTVKGEWKEGKLDGEVLITRGDEQGKFMYRMGVRIE